MEATAEVTEAAQGVPDLCDLYLDMSLDTEAPLLFHRWSLLTAIGAALERKVFIRHGNSHIYPNMYTMLVGPSSSRKTSAISEAVRIAKGAGFQETFEGTTTKEKFLEDLHTGFGNINAGADNFLEGATPAVSNVLVAAGEAIAFYGVNNVGMVNEMTDLWDCHDRKSTSSKRGGTLHIKKPTVSFLGGTTTAQLSNMFPPEMIGQGILSRTLMIYCHGSGRKITYPEPTDPQVANFLNEQFKLITHKQGEFKYSDDAKAAIDTIYHAWKPIKDGRFDSYTGRRLNHLLKLCLIYSCMDLNHNSNTILLEHVIKANTTLAYAEGQMIDALGEFGGALNSNLTNIVMNVIRANRGGITQDAVLGAVHTEYAQQRDVLTVLIKLRDAGKIDAVMAAGKNGVMERKFYPVSSILNTDLPHVDYNLLLEYTEERGNS